MVIFSRSTTAFHFWLSSSTAFLKASPVKGLASGSNLTADLYLAMAAGSLVTAVISAMRRSVPLALRVTEEDKYTGGLVGVTVPVGPGLIRFSYSRVKFKNDPGLTLPTVFSPDRDASTNKIAISYVHNLSKRTALYATAARIRVKNGENNPAIMGATALGSPTYLSTGNGVAGYRPRSATGFDFGIRHAF